jgi:lipopolysaccharide transport system ATP-binding protein
LSAIAIRVENLSKRYCLGPREPYRALRDVLARALSAPFRHIRSTFHRSNVQGSNDRYIWALKDVSFEVRQGEVVGIIGRNGAGKTTLLKILSRITKPTAGFAEVRGRVGSLLEVGTGFHPELTGRENIYLNGAILGMKKAEIDRKFDEIVAFAEIERFIDTPVKYYSSGMYVRLAFAVAAHLEPEILLVDEVLAVGDAAFQKKCLGKMGDVAKEGRTVLFVSHNMGAVIQLCHRALLLRAGMIAVDSSPTHTINVYLGSGDAGAYYVSENSGSELKDVFIRWAQIAHPPNARLNFGESLTIDVLCCAKRASTIALEVIIRDQMGHPIIFLPSGLRFNQEFTILEGTEKTVSCLIPYLPLAEGKYYIDLLVAASGYGVLDRREQCLAFEVVSSDPCGTQRSFTQQTGQGCVHVDAIFSDR